MTFGEHDHDIALLPGAGDASRGKELKHIGLQVDCDNDMESLRRWYGWMIQKDVKIHEVLDHGVSTGVYFSDPDGHQLQVFCRRIPDSGGAAIAELGRNEGRALNIELEPLFE
jgi:catechol-2,3-dioxygenase